MQAYILLSRYKYVQPSACNVKLYSIIDISKVKFCGQTTTFYFYNFVSCPGHVQIKFYVLRNHNELLLPNVSIWFNIRFVVVIFRTKHNSIRPSTAYLPSGITTVSYTHLVSIIILFADFFFMFTFLVIIIIHSAFQMCIRDSNTGICIIRIY